MKSIPLRCILPFSFALALCGCQLLPSAGTINQVSVGKFHQYEAQQHTREWCWAACIQMVLRSHGVAWTQADIVSSVKGSDVVKAGTDAEMRNFHNSMGQNLNGRRWKAACEWGSGSPPPEKILEEISAGRPMIITYNTGPTSGHAVVLFGAEFTERNGRKSLKNVFLFEPTAAERLVVDSTVLYRKVKTWFAVKVGFVGETTYDLVKNSKRPSLYIPVLGDILRGGMIRVQVGEKPRPLEAHEYQQRFPRSQ